MADRGGRDGCNGKKRRAMELEREAEEWATPTPSTAAGTSKIRLGKRYQAVLPALQSTEQTEQDTTMVEMDDGEDEDMPTHATTHVRLNMPRSISSASALDAMNASELKKYLSFASKLVPAGYAHGTAAATTANALHLLHQHDHNILSAACILYATHAYPMGEVGTDTDVPDKKQLKPKHQDWLAKFYRLVALKQYTEETLDQMDALNKSSNSIVGDSVEAQVLNTLITRIDDWKKTCDEAAIRSCSPSELHGLLHEAHDLKCETLPQARAISLRLEAFELAKARLFQGIASEKSKGNKKSAKLALEPLQALLTHVKSFSVRFAQEAYWNQIVNDAIELQNQITQLLQQDKASVPVIRDVLAKVDATPVDLSNVVEPLKAKMVSAQKWLERARKVMPPTKRQSSRIAVDGGKSKMDLEMVHELVKSAPVDEQSSEMQEMEELLAYADSWAQKVEEAMNNDDLPIETLREYLEEGLEMPVVMDLTVALEATIDARQWVLKAKEEISEICCLDTLQTLLDEADEIRERVAPRTWSPSIVEDIRTSVTQAETWLNELLELVGTSIWLKWFPNEKPSKNKAKIPLNKAPMAKLAQIIESSPFKVDMERYLTPLQDLMKQGQELTTSIAHVIQNANEDQAFQNATTLLETLDGFPCELDQGETLREMVTIAKEWLTRVRAICVHPPPPPLATTAAINNTSNRRLTKKQSATLSTPTSNSANTAPEETQVTVDNLRQLQSTTLAFQFPEERATLQAEIDNVSQWQEQTRQELTQQVEILGQVGALLENYDMKDRERRQIKWQKKLEMIETKPLHFEVQIEVDPKVSTSPVKEAPETNLTEADKMECKNEEQPSQQAAEQIEQATVQPEKSSTMAEDLVQVVQGLCGGRPRGSDEKKTTSQVDWTPLLNHLEKSLGYISALDAKAKEEEDSDEESPNEEKNGAKQRLDQCKMQLNQLLAGANGLVHTEEATVLSTILRALEWFTESQAMPTQSPDVNSIAKYLDAGQQYQRLLLDSQPSWFSLPTSNWISAIFWPLKVLGENQNAMNAWLDDVETKMNGQALHLFDMERILAKGESVGADDRFLWQELKKTKTWLIKVKKAIKTKTPQSKLAMNTINNLVDEGSKMKIHQEVFAILQKQFNEANDWETRLKASGLDAGRAKIATLVELLEEYNKANFFVDLDMHRDVLISATEQYCICRQPYDGFMIGCEHCDDWFHDTCVGISKEKAEKVEDYVCPSCQLLQELKTLIRSALDGANQLFDNEDKIHEKSIGIALRRVKKEERDVEKAQMTLLEIQTQVTAIGQHVQYLEKMQEEPTKQTLPSITIPLSHHPTSNGLANPNMAAQMFKNYQPILRTGPFSSHPSPYLQPMPSGLPLKTSPSPGNAPPPPILPPLTPSNKETTKADLISAQEVEITRFKMEQFKLKQMAHDAEVAVQMSKERVAVARAAIDTLLVSRDVLLPKAQQWWQQVHVVLSQLLVEKERFNLSLLLNWANECQSYSDKFASVGVMQKVLHIIPWTIDIFALLHGHPKPSYDALDTLLKQSLHEPKVLLPLRGVLQRTDQWKMRSQKNVQKILAAKKLDRAKIQAIVNEYMKMPLTCKWGQKLEAFMTELETRDPLLPPPTLDITPPSSPQPTTSVGATPSTTASSNTTQKRKPNRTNSNTSSKKAKVEGGKKPKTEAGEG